MPNPKRRAIQFETVDQITPEVERLKAAHRLVGNWSLGQVCRHLEASFQGSIRGLDLRNHRIKRFFFAKRMLAQALRSGIPEGYTVDPGIEPPSNVNENEAMDGLARAIERYRHHQGRLHPHPLFGRLSREMWDRVHCVHSAHHLSFVIPAP